MRARIGHALPWLAGLAVPLLITYAWLSLAGFAPCPLLDNGGLS